MPIQALGKVAVPVPGTPVRVYAGSPAVRGKSIVVQALAANAGPVFIGTAGMLKATGAAVSAQLAASASISFDAQEGNPLNPEQLYVDANNAGDGIYVTVVG